MKQITLKVARSLISGVFDSKNGRHSTYDDAVAERVCELIASGKTLREVAGFAGIPSEGTIFNWLRDPDHEDFRAAYRLAINQRTDGFHEASSL